MTSRSPVTLTDIATYTGLSVGTVSRALAGRGDLSKRTRERVADAAEALGYTRAATTSGRPTSLDPRLIEFVVGDFHDEWEDSMTAYVRDAAFAHGYDLVLTRERAEPKDDWPARVVTRRPSGVILGIIHPTSRQLRDLRALRTPLVLLDPRADSEHELVSVGTTDHRGGFDAGAHLVECGYESFVFVGSVPQYRFGRARREGFVAAINDMRPGAEMTFAHAQLTASLIQVLKQRTGRVGVFAANDEMALAVYRAAAVLKKRIPNDIGVIGFNDEPRAATASPPLTSVRPPMSDMAQKAIELIREFHESGGLARERIELPSALIIRGSTSRPAT
jgi:LacI family transcriptional regulator